MGCNTSTPKDILFLATQHQSPHNQNQILNSTNQIINQIPNEIPNDISNDISNLDFVKAQQDLHQVGQDLETALNEGMNELMVEVITVNSENTSTKSFQTQQQETVEDLGSMTLELPQEDISIPPSQLNQHGNNDYIMETLPIY